MSTSTVTDFSSPIYTQEDGGFVAADSTPLATVSGGSTPAADFSTTEISSEGTSASSPGATLDLSDPIFLSEDLDSNENVDAYAAPPPLPDGRWRAKLKQIDVKGPGGEMVRYKPGATKKDARPYLMTALEAKVQDATGKHDGQNVYDRFVSTLPARNGGIPIVRILTCLGVKLPAKGSHKLYMDMLLKALAGEPELEIETAWEGQLEQADQETVEAAGHRVPTVRGMHRFPEDGKGGRIPDLDIEVGGKKYHMRAQARITGYHPLSKK
jgi:hypothetical protein